MAGPHAARANALSSSRSCSTLLFPSDFSTHTFSTHIHPQLMWPSSTKTVTGQSTQLPRASPSGRTGLANSSPTTDDPPPRRHGPTGPPLPATPPRGPPLRPIPNVRPQSGLTMNYPTWRSKSPLRPFATDLSYEECVHFDVHSHLAAVPFPLTGSPWAPRRPGRTGSPGCGPQTNLACRFKSRWQLCRPG